MVLLDTIAGLLADSFCGKYPETNEYWEESDENIALGD
jgi:hypothetical protein